MPSQSCSEAVCQMWLSLDSVLPILGYSRKHLHKAGKGVCGYKELCTSELFLPVRMTMELRSRVLRTMLADLPSSPVGPHPLDSHALALPVPLRVRNTIMSGGRWQLVRQSPSASCSLSHMGIPGKQR